MDLKPPPMDLKPPPMGSAVSIRTHGPGAGVRWLLQGLQLLRQQPLGLPAMTVIYLLLHFPAFLPGIGLAAATLLAPFATLGLMAACREVAAGRAPTPMVYVALFQNAAQRRALLRLGIANMLLTLVAVTLMLLLGLEKMPGTETTAPPATTLDWSRISMQFAFYAPIAVLMWFAPMLAGWHDSPPAKALFGSAVACWRNMTPMLAFALAVGAGLLALGTVLGLLLSAFGASTEFASFLVAPLALVFLAAVQAGFYAMYAEIFTETESFPPLQGGESGN